MAGLTVVYGHGRLLFFDPAIAARSVAALLPLVLTTGGVLVSMTAPTVRAPGSGCWCRSW